MKKAILIICLGLGLVLALIGFIPILILAICLLPIYALTVLFVYAAFLLDE